MRPEASGNALDLSRNDRPLNQREIRVYGPHIRGTGAGDDPTSESGSSSDRSRRVGTSPDWAPSTAGATVGHRVLEGRCPAPRERAHVERERSPCPSPQAGGRVGANRYVGPRAERVTVKALLALVAQDYATPGTAPVARSNQSGCPGVRAGHLRAVAVSSGAIESLQVQAVGDGKAKATINRELACLRRAYRLASQSRPPLISANRVPRSTSTERTTCERGSSVPRTI